MSINEEFNKFIQDDPKNLFNMNASSYIRNKSVPLISALELYGIKLKDNKFLYYYAYKQIENYMKYLMNISMILGWIINLFGIIITSYYINLSCHNINFITSIGNLITVILITIINISNFQEKIINFKIIANKYDKLYTDLQFKISVNNTEQELLNYLKNIELKDLYIKESCEFIIPEYIIDSYYSNHGKLTFQEAINEFYLAMSKKIEDYNNDSNI